MTESPTFTLISAIDGAEVVQRRWSIEDSYRYCRKIALSHYENFPVGSILIPSGLRNHFYSIYAYARTADDFADEAGDYTPEDRLALLGRWGEMLSDCYRGLARHPIFIALAETVSTFNLPIGLFEDLLSAFRQDVIRNRYDNFTELVDYCRRSANPIGRLVLLLFGYSDPALHGLSDSFCTALQLTNHWQDVAVDLAGDRIYLPADDLSRFGLTVDELKRLSCGEEFRELLAFEIRRTRSLFEEARSLCFSVNGRLSLELHTVWLGGMTILDRIEHSGYDVFSRRPSITALDKARIAMLALTRQITRLGGWRTSETL